MPTEDTKKIVKKGPPNFGTTCRKCGTNFRYTLADVHKNELRFCNSVTCPSCGEEATHPMRWGRPEQ